MSRRVALLSVALLALLAVFAVQVRGVTLEIGAEDDALQLLGDERLGALLSDPLLQRVETSQAVRSKEIDPIAIMEAEAAEDSSAISLLETDQAAERRRRRRARRAARAPRRKARRGGRKRRGGIRRKGGKRVIRRRGGKKGARKGGRKGRKGARKGRKGRKGVRKGRKGRKGGKGGKGRKGRKGAKGRKGRKGGKKGRKGKKKHDNGLRASDFAISHVPVKKHTAGAKLVGKSAMSTVPAEVFYYAVGPMKYDWLGKPSTAYPWNNRQDAEAACKSIGSTLATAAQLQDAYRKGAEWCACGAVKDAMFSFPMQRVLPGCGIGIGITNSCHAGGANCYGVKPHQGKTPGVHPFAPNRYYHTEPVLAKVSPDGFKPTYITDWGYQYDRVWFDALGDGKRNDYGRWVGNAPNIWYSVALRDCPDSHTAKDVYVVSKDGVVSPGPAYTGFKCASRPARLADVGRLVPSKAPAGDPQTVGAPSGYKNPAITDFGYGHDRLFVDVFNNGQFDHYGRWVGNAGGIWYSVALKGCPQQHSKQDEFVFFKGKVYRGPNYKHNACIKKWRDEERAIKKSGHDNGLRSHDFLISHSPVKTHKVGDKLVSRSALAPAAPEVFYYAVGPMKWVWNGLPGSAYPWNKREEAEAACKSIGATLATAAQLLDAQRKGAEWCACGGTKDAPFSFPMQHVAGGCGGKIGVTDTCTAGGANCYGIKPHLGTPGVAPFAPNRFYQVPAVMNKVSPDGFKPTYITDWGYEAKDRVWLDALGDGKRNDYGRWVGNAPNIWFSVALRDCPDQHTTKDVYVISSTGVVTAGPAYTGFKCVARPSGLADVGRLLPSKPATGDPKALGAPTGYKNPTITDWGYAHERTWVDVFNNGKFEHYGRWVGNAGGIWFSLALKDCPNQYSLQNEFVFFKGKVYRGVNYKKNACIKKWHDEKMALKALGKAFPAVPVAADPMVSPHGYRSKHIKDWGYASRERLWLDVRGAGVKNDFGRWVGNAPNEWFSVALWDCPNQHSAKDEYQIKNGKVYKGPAYKGFDCPSRPKPPAPKRAALDPASRHKSGAINLAPSGYKNRFLTDFGYAHDRQWVDVRGAGVREDYGRWVGKQPDVFYSIALKDCANQYSARGEWILERGAVKKGPNYKGAKCDTKVKTTEKKWVKPAADEPWRAKPLKQVHYDKIRHARASVAKKQVAKLSCPADLFIQVKDATFGSGAGVWQSSGWISKGSCHLKDSRVKAANKCNTKSSCELSPDSATFGADPCPGDAQRELLVTYECVASDQRAPLVKPVRVQPSYEGISVREFKDGENAYIACDGGKKVHLLDASYGAKQGFYASNGFIAKGKCHASNTASVISDKCHAKENCQFKLDGAMFAKLSGDCDADSKLKVTFRCDDNPPRFTTPAAPSARKWAEVKKAPEIVVPQPAEIAAAIKPGQKPGDQILTVGDSEVHIHVTQLAPPEPHAKALLDVEARLDKLHGSAMSEVEKLLDEIESNRKDKKPCLKKLEATIEKFKAEFVKESQNVQLATHKYSYADSAPTLVS